MIHPNAAKEVEQDKKKTRVTNLEREKEEAHKAQREKKERKKERRKAFGMKPEGWQFALTRYLVENTAIGGAVAAPAIVTPATTTTLLLVLLLLLLLRVLRKPCPMKLFAGVRVR